MTDRACWRRACSLRPEEFYYADEHTKARRMNAGAELF